MLFGGRVKSDLSLEQTPTGCDYDTGLFLTSALQASGPRYKREYRVYLGVKTCEDFFCFVAIVRGRSIMLTSLLSLFYVTGECQVFTLRMSQLAHMRKCFRGSNEFEDMMSRLDFVRKRRR